MATIDIDRAAGAAGERLSVFRVSFTGAIVAFLLFLLCWIGAFVPLGPVTHMYIQLFTAADIRSATALAEGICWSLVFGAVIGALVAFVYNGLGPLLRR